MTKLTVYEGRPKPIVIVGKNAVAMAEFAEKNRGWHSVRKDPKDQFALASLVKRGAVVVNEFGQFKWHC